MRRLQLLCFVIFLSCSQVASGQAVSNWYHQWQALDGAGIGSGILYNWIIYPDSNLLTPSSWYGTAQNTYYHGMGFSFDPTDHSYSYNTVNPVLPAIPDTGQSYTVDSISILYDYIRNNPSTTIVDSMIIEVSRTTPGSIDSEAYNLEFSSGYRGPAEWTSDLYTGYGYDNAPRYSTLVLDNHGIIGDAIDSSKLSGPSSKVRIAVPLNHSSHHETSTTGIFDSSWFYNVSLGTGIYVKYGEHLVANVYFKSGVNYVLNTSTNVSNFLVLYAGNPTSSSGVPFGQTPSNSATGYPGSFNVGLINNNVNRYNIYGGYHELSHTILIPANAYNYDVAFEAPYYGFHVKYNCVTPDPGHITTISSIQQDNSVYFVDSSIIGGTWSVSNSHVGLSTMGSHQIMTAMSPGVDTILYTVTNTCGASAVAMKTVTVTPMRPICAGTNDTLSQPYTISGAWTSSNPAVAAVDGSYGYSTSTYVGVVTGFSAGTAVITYNSGIYYSGGPEIITMLVTVNPNPSAGAITGAVPECTGASSSVLSDGVSGGVWTSGGTSVSIIGSTGRVTGVSTGTNLISYTVTNVCGSAVATATMTVLPNPYAASISGGSSVCPGAEILLTDSVTGGAWSSSSTGIATVAGGSVSGVVSGTAIISYAVTTTCGTAYASKIITVNPLPNAGSISGASSACPGSSITLTDGSSGGVWSSGSMGVATVAGGIVSGVAAGTATISYEVTTGCGSAYATYPVTVNALPVAGSITGLSSLCAGSSITLSDVDTGGVWTSSIIGTASVSGGVTAGVSAGTVIISYAVTNVCGTAYATDMITVNPLPNAGVITGASSLCPATITTLSDAVPGGVWSSSNYTVAGVSSTGIVNGVVAGTAVITYEVTTVCGSAMTATTMTVNPRTSAGTITGSSSICNGADSTLTDGVSGGVWSATNINAFVSTGGVVHGSAAGRDTIYYSVTGMCGTAVASHVVIIDPTPTADAITGADTLCVGSFTTFDDSTARGEWSATNTNAFIAASGELYGIKQGVDTVVYTVTNACGSATAYKLLYVSDCISSVNTVAQESEITLYPNPTDNHITINASVTLDLVEVTNLVGEKVIAATNNSKEATISLAPFPSGVYFVRVNGDRVFKVVKQ